MTSFDAARWLVRHLVAAEPDIARVPVMVDSSKWTVIEAGLKCIQGKAVVIHQPEGGEEAFIATRASSRYGRDGGDGFDEQGRRTPSSASSRSGKRCYDI